MTFLSRNPRRTGRPAAVRPTVVLMAAVLGAGALGAASPAAAADPTTPWLTVSEGFASFAVPTNAIQKAMGNVAGVVVEANFGPSSVISELGLTKSDQAWTAVIGPLQPGSYSYRFRGDDSKILKDPTNSATVTSDPTWSTFFVPGDSASLLADPPKGQGGAMATVKYPSGAKGRQRSAMIWTPPGYDARRKQPYPVLYLQPGAGGGPADFSELGRAGQILDNLAAQRRMEPMVVVMGDATVSDIPAELDAIVRATRGKYNLAKDSAHRAVAGLSEGADLVIRTALGRRIEFGYVGSFAGLAADDNLRIDARKVDAEVKMLRLYTGNMTDPAYNATYRLMRALDQAKIRYEFDGVNPNAGHTWKAWQDNLIDFVPRLFRSRPDNGPSAGHLPLTKEFVAPKPGTTPTPWLTTESNGDTFVTIETGAGLASAKHVTLWGNWAPGGAWVNVPMTPTADRWRSTIGPLKPWFYYYKFIVDLTSTKDAANPTRFSTESTWSSFMVSGEQSRLLVDVPSGRGGAVAKLDYDSTVAGERRSAYVWTPPGYDAQRKDPYPVLYLQHGGGQNYTDWLEMGRAKQILDNEYLDGKIVPMVVVMGNGNVSDFPSELISNIVPAARAKYNIASDPAKQALAGLSMGGFQTFDVLKKYPGRFSYIGTFSSGVFDSNGFDVAAVNRGTKLLRIYTGNVTDFARPVTLSTMASFDSLGIKYEFAGTTEGPHGWDTWQKNLIDFAPRLFQPVAG